jgi:gluconate 2-dehydrogenase gamma chain
MAEQENGNPRRTFLIQVAKAAGAGSLASTVVANETVAAPAPTVEHESAAPEPYQSLSPDEASFVEALVNVMCPADEYSPNGVDCGLATYIDRQLAGPHGKGAGRYQRGPFRSGKPEHGLQLPLTPEEFCKAGIAAADAACFRERGKTFSELARAEADAFIKAIHEGRVKSDGIALAQWFNEGVYPLFVEACFADPMYGGNRNAVFWRMLGFPGLPATHTLDMTRYRGKPYPGAKNPKSIADFT